MHTQSREQGREVLQPATTVTRRKVGGCIKQPLDATAVVGGDSLGVQPFQQLPFVEPAGGPLLRPQVVKSASRQGRHNHPRLKAARL